MVDPSLPIHPRVGFPGLRSWNPLRRGPGILLAFLAFSHPPASISAPPKADYLFPAGGLRGGKATLTVGGLDGKASVWASHPGIQVTPVAGKKSGKFLADIAPEVPCGIHWLRFFNQDGAAVLRPFLVNQIPEMMEQEPNDHPRKPQDVASVPVVINGRLEKLNDTDVFAVSLKKGQTLVAAVEAHRMLGSPMDAVLEVLSPEGFVLARNDDFNDIDPFLAFEAPADGKFLVRVYCFPSVPNSRVGLFGKENCVYRLTMTTGPYVDHAWPLAMERTKPGEVELIGWNIPPDRRRVPVTMPKDGDFAFVQPPGFANGTSLRIEPHTCSTQGPVLPPATFSGRISDQKGSRIELVAKKGEKFRLQVEARTLHFPLEPVLILRDGGGKQIKRSQAAKLNTDPVLDFTAPAAGKFTLEVRDLYDQAGPRHAFRLRCLPLVPDFDVSLPTDRFDAAAGKPLDISATITRRDGFKGRIELIAEGLEDCKQTMVETKDPKKAVLRLSDLKAGTRTPFRLYAAIEGKKETRRAVTVLLTDLDLRPPHLWLTVGGK